MRCNLYTTPLASIGSSVIAFLGILYTYIGVGLSALLVSTCRAMREPQFVERATGLTPRLFILSNKRITFFFSPKGSKGMLLRLWNLKTVEKEFLKIRFYVQFTEIKNRRTTFPEKELHFDKRLLISERIYTYCYQNIFSKWRIKF